MTMHATMLCTIAEAANAIPTHGNPERAAAVTLVLRRMEKRRDVLR
jgi:hypothetical protein